MELSIVPLTKSLYQWRGQQRRPLPPPPPPQDPPPRGYARCEVTGGGMGVVVGATGSGIGRGGTRGLGLPTAAGWAERCSIRLNELMG